MTGEPLHLASPPPSVTFCISQVSTRKAEPEVSVCLSVYQSFQGNGYATARLVKAKSGCQKWKAENSQAQGKADLELLPSDLPASSSLVAGTMGVYQCVQLHACWIKDYILAKCHRKSTCALTYCVISNLSCYTLTNLLCLLSNLFTEIYIPQSLGIYIFSFIGWFIP